MGGEILFQGEDILKKSEAELREIRGGEIAMIFQDSLSALNPVYTVGNKMVELIRRHTSMTKKEAKARVLELLTAVGITDPEKAMRSYPHELSGGMRQRVMIAMAMSSNPKVLIADEPTTALDVTIQAQILHLLLELQKKNNMSIILITHDLGVIAEVADDVMVMYAGKVVEYGSADDIFESPKHPYTSGLMNCIPKLTDEDHTRLDVIKGMVPSFDQMPKGCAFCPRCSEAKDICRERMPELMDVNGHKVRCFKYSKEWEEA